MCRSQRKQDSRFCSRYCNANSLRFTATARGTTAARRFWFSTMGIYLLRTQKQASYTPFTREFADFRHDVVLTSRQIDFANEYVIEVPDDSFERVQFAASVAVWAERALILKGAWIYVAVWKLTEGQSVDFSTPLAVLVPPRRQQVRQFSTGVPQPPPHRWTWHLNADGVTGFADRDFMPFTAVETVDQFDYKSHVDSETEPFLGIRIARDCERGRGRHQLYRYATTGGDVTVRLDKGLVLRREGNCCKKRFPVFKERMRWLFPFLSDCFIGNDGIVKRGPRLTTNIYPAGVSDLALPRRREAQKSAAALAFESELRATRTELLTALAQNEIYSVSHSNELILELPDVSAMRRVWRCIARTMRLLNAAFGCSVPVYTPSSPYAEFAGINYIFEGELQLKSGNAQQIVDLLASYNHIYTVFGLNPLTFESADWSGRTTRGFDATQNAYIRGAFDTRNAGYLNDTQASRRNAQNYFAQWNAITLRLLAVFAWLERSLQLNTRYKTTPPKHLYTRLRGPGSAEATLQLYEGSILAGRAKNPARQLYLFRNSANGHFYVRNTTPYPPTLPAYTPPKPRFMLFSPFTAAATSPDNSAAFSTTLALQPAQNYLATAPRRWEWRNQIDPLDAEIEDAEAVRMLEEVEQRAPDGVEAIYKIISLYLSSQSSPLSLPPYFLIKPSMNKLLDGINPNG